MNSVGVALTLIRSDGGCVMSPQPGAYSKKFGNSGQLNPFRFICCARRLWSVAGLLHGRGVMPGSGQSVRG